MKGATLLQYGFNVLVFTSLTSTVKTVTLKLFNTLVELLCGNKYVRICLLYFVF